jgi:hypothetical protein
MSDRHDGAIADILRSAANIYEEAIAVLERGDVSQEAFASANGKRALADVVDEVAACESTAIARLEEVARALPAID